MKELLLDDNMACTRGDILYSSATTAGRAAAITNPASTTQHFREIGHALESKTAGTNTLVWATIHFN